MSSSNLVSQTLTKSNSEFSAPLSPAGPGVVNSFTLTERGLAGFCGGGGTTNSSGTTSDPSSVVPPGTGEASPANSYSTLVLIQDSQIVGMGNLPYFQVI